jgi:hypothetical protein
MSTKPLGTNRTPYPYVYSILVSSGLQYLMPAAHNRGFGIYCIPPMFSQCIDGRGTLSTHCACIEHTKDTVCGLWGKKYHVVDPLRRHPSTTLSMNKTGCIPVNRQMPHCLGCSSGSCPVRYKTLGMQPGVATGRPSTPSCMRGVSPSWS